MRRIPYGISNFRKIRLENAYYVDRTQYIETLENMEQYVIFLRPRRFGKSLFIMMLDNYYGIQHHAEFNAIFDGTYIGEHPTPSANQYLILNLHFSGINTTSPEVTLQGFLHEVKEKVISFFYRYSEWFEREDIDNIKQASFPNEVIKSLIEIMERREVDRKIYVLIDEYDHFANDLLAFDFEQFQNAVSKNGFVRKFYEELKEGTKKGIIDRLFITGVSAITLDSMTSGFNIGANLTLSQDLSTMLGFTEEEVIDILKYIEVEKGVFNQTLADFRAWYDGYRFSPDATERVFNPGMVLYYAKHYKHYKEPPRELLDENIATDYSKVKRMFKVANKERENIAHLQELLETGTLSANFNRAFSFEKGWTKSDLVSLLYYNGILTIWDESLDSLVFRIPNFVIRQLYFQYFTQIVIQESKLPIDDVDVRERIRNLAINNNIAPLMELVSDVIGQLGREDMGHFNESSLKSIFTAFFYVVGFYNIYSELEVRKSPVTKGRVDLLLTARAPFRPDYEFVFELKYLRQSQRNQFAAKRTEAIQQLQDYLASDDNLRQQENLQAYAVIFVGQAGTVVDVRDERVVFEI